MCIALCERHCIMHANSGLLVLGVGPARPCHGQSVTELMQRAAAVDNCLKYHSIFFVNSITYLRVPIFVFGHGCLHSMLMVSAGHAFGACPQKVQLSCHAGFIAAVYISLFLVVFCSDVAWSSSSSRTCTVVTAVSNLLAWQGIKRAVTFSRHMISFQECPDACEECM